MPADGLDPLGSGTGEGRSGGGGWGIQAGYHDVWGTWRTPSAEAARRIRRAMGATTDDPDEAAPTSTPLRIVRPDSAVAIGARPAGVGSPPTGWRTHTSSYRLVLEDGTEVRVNDGVLPPDLPLGYHQLHLESGAGATKEHLVVAPPRAHLPPSTRTWGITAQLYAARSRTSWGIGDLRDLHALATWAASHGASTIGLNPLHASTPVGPPADSPYSPSSRRWKDPIYLDVASLATAAKLADADQWNTVGVAMNESPRIDRATVWAHKLAVLEEIWTQSSPISRTAPAFAAFRAEHGPGLTRWGTWCALAERHGPSWTRWPAEFRHPDHPAIARFAADPAVRDRVEFWGWLQWLVDVQVDRASANTRIVKDLAVGFAADGFDAWEWQDLLAPGARIGAPPDLLGPVGQDWGLPPFVPWRMRGQAYAPLAETIRANLRHAAGLRIDHVMGLLRLFWIPPDMGAADGAYVGWEGRDLLDIVALESARAGAFVVGEDLGTVEPGVREVLRDTGLLSTRLLWFEDDPPEQWPDLAMAAITTHDLPTVAGVWSGTDLADQAAAGLPRADDADATMRHRLRVAASCDDQAPLDHVLVAAHERLATAPSMLATAALDDLVGAVHRPNIPGTIDEHPNWRIPLPVPIDELPDHPLAQQVSAAMARQGRSGDGARGGT